MLCNPIQMVMYKIKINMFKFFDGTKISDKISRKCTFTNNTYVNITHLIII